jgi:hypothetical protein
MRELLRVLSVGSGQPDLGSLARPQRLEGDAPAIRRPVALARAGDELARRVSASRHDKVALAAVLACLGDEEGHARVLRALTGDDDADVGIAQVYLHHRPIVDAREIRTVANGIARMPERDGQIRALDTLAAHRVSDPDSLAALAALFLQAKTLQVQRAIAGILIRADHRELPRADLIALLTSERRVAPDGTDDIIDALIRTLRSP